MAAGTEAVALLQQREAEAVVRVVVDRVELHRDGELLPRLREPPAAVVGATERLAHRALLGLEVAGPLQRDRRGVRVLRGEQATALLEGLVGGLHRHPRPFGCRHRRGPTGTGKGVCENPGRPHPRRIEARPCPIFFPSPDSVTHDRRWRRRHQRRVRATLRRHRPRRSCCAAGTRPAQFHSPDPPRLLRRGRRGARPVAGRRRARDRRQRIVLRVPDALHRRRRRAPQHHRRARCARARQRRRPGDHAPRAHAAEGQVRPARAAARHPRQPRPDLGPLPRRGLHRAPGRRRRAARDRHRRRGQPSRAVAGRRPRAGRGDPRR